VRWALLIAAADNPEHLALLFADELVEGETWLVAIRGLHSPACGAFCCLGHHVVNVVHPRDPIVRVGEAGANPQSRRAAGAADISPPGSGILGRVEPGYDRPVPSQFLKVTLDDRVLGAHGTKPRLCSCRGAMRKLARLKRAGSVRSALLNWRSPRIRIRAQPSIERVR